jgi:hypothetical protein
MAAAASTAPRSGAPSVSGVGTVMTATSKSSSSSGLDTPGSGRCRARPARWRGNVLHVGAAGCQRVGLVDVGVEPGDVEAGVDRRHRHGQPDIALADEQYLHGGVLCVLAGVAGC